MDPEDDNLMSDLLAQLDSRDKAVQEESAAVLNEMHLDEKVDQLEAKPKLNAKSRFQARQVSVILAPTDWLVKLKFSKD